MHDFLMPKIRLGGLIMTLLFCVTVIKAQDKQRNFFRLGENDLAVSVDTGQLEAAAASRTLKRIEDLPVTVYIITRDEILGNGYTTLVEALGSLPGIRISQPGSAVDGEEFQVQGIYGNYYCKILVDGIPIQPSVVSGMPIGRQLPIRQAERIEVIFGPASSAFGSEAMAGVVNIVTHKSDRPVIAQADVGLGSDGLEYLNVLIGGKAGKNKNVLTYGLFGGTASQRDLRVKYDRNFLYNPSLYDSTYSFLSKPYFEGDSTNIEMERLPQSSRMLGFSLDWRGFTVQAMVMSRITHSSIGKEPSTFYYYNPLSLWSETIQRYTASYRKQWKKVSSESSISWLNYRVDNQSSFAKIASGLVYKYAASDDIQVEEVVSITPLPDLDLVSGIMYQYSGNLPITNDLDRPFQTNNYKPFSRDPIRDTSSLGEFGYNPLTFQRAGAFVQLYYQVKRFTLFGGYRLDYHSQYDLAHSPRIAFMYRSKKDFSARVSFGTGYRVPSNFFVYNSLANKEGGGAYYTNVPNTSLQPEKMIATEAGIRWSRLKWIKIDATLFYHRIYEQFTRSFVLLDTALYPDAVNPLRLSHAYVNDENSLAEIFGLQANIGFHQIIPAIRLDIDLDLTLSKGREVLPNNLGKIDDYRQMPRFMGQLNFSIWPLERLRILIQNNFSSGWVRGYLPLDPDLLKELGYPVDIKGYYTLGIQARVIISKNFGAFIHFNNVTNAHYGGFDGSQDETELFYNPQYGFNFMFGLNFRME